MTQSILLLIFFISFIDVSFCNSQKCFPRNDNFESAICVCNSDYCDTIKRPPSFSEDEYVLYTSSQAGARFQMERGTFEEKVDISLSQNAILTNAEHTFQSIIGWGGAFTDATGININHLDSSAKTLLLRSYFSEDGLEYSLGRVPIAGTDFSTRFYTYNDGDTDPDLQNFKLASEDHKYKIPLIQEAVSLSNANLKLYAAAWFAPMWMIGSDKLYCKNYIKNELYQAWANYLIKFLEAYKKEGLHFWGISTGNAGATAANFIKELDDFPLVGWLPNNLSTWVAENLGPTIRNSEFSSVKIMTVDDGIVNYPIYIDKIFESNEIARKYIDGFALHWYANKEELYPLLSETHEKYNNKFILGSEACIDLQLSNTTIIMGSWERAEKYAYDIIKVLQNWATGWTDWNLVLDLNGGPNYINNFVDAPILVNATASEFYKQPMYYALGHFSKFIPRDSQRIQVVQSMDNLEIVAFRRPSGENAAVLLNMKITNVTINWTNKNGRGIKRTIPAKSITTILYY